MRPGRVVTFGESLLTLRARGPIRLGPEFQAGVAGAESNVAIGLARLGHEVTWAGVVGDDEHGEYILRTLRAENVHTHHRISLDRPTGLMLVEKVLGTTARVSYHRARSAGSTLSADDVLPVLTEDVSVIHVTGITPALSTSAAEATAEVIRQAKDRGITVSVDINYRQKLWSRDEARQTLSPLVRDADIVVGSEDEFDLVGEGEPRHVAKGLLSGGASVVAIKRGADGAELHTQDASFEAAAHRVSVVDTIGAGDAFTAGLLSGLLDGLGHAQALSRGIACGAFAVTAVGDWEGAPTRGDLAMLDLAPGETLR